MYRVRAQQRLINHLAGHLWPGMGPCVVLTSLTPAELERMAESLGYPPPAPEISTVEKRKPGRPRKA